MVENGVMVLRRFDKYDEENYKVIDFAWPVEVCECSANKAAERQLDALSEAVLKLIDIGICGDKEISGAVSVDSEIIKYIKQFVLAQYRYISHDHKTVTDEGRKYLLDGESCDYQSEKVFGQMFISIPDGEVMPYFLEGKLPAVRSFRDEVKLLSNDASEAARDTSKFASKFMQQYKLFCKISKYSDDDEIDEIQFVEDEFRDVAYEEVDDPGEVKTLADTEIEKKSSFDFVRLLNTKRRKIYLKTKIVFCRDNPEQFMILSPFEKNITTWYTKRMTWLKENNATIRLENGREVSLNELLDDTVQEFYIQFPELQAENFDYYIRVNYPNLSKVKSLPHQVIEIFRELYNRQNLYENGRQIDEKDLISKSYILLETLLNNYISFTSNRKTVIDRCKLIGSSPDNIKGIFKSIGVQDCAAIEDNKLRDIMRKLHTFQYGRVGNSIVDRYFFLVMEAYFCGKNPFRKILRNRGTDFIEKLDFVFGMRNRYGAHSDDVVEKVVSAADFKRFESSITEIFKILINTLYEEEQSNV